MIKPRIPIYDKRFVWRDSASTDIRITFAAARERMEAETKLRNKITTLKQRRQG